MPLNFVKKYSFSTLFTFWVSASCFSQDSLKLHPHSIKPTTDFDQRFYYVPGDEQNVWGYRIGVLINDQYKLGIGGYYMNEKSDATVPPSPIARTSAGTQTNHHQLYIGTIYYEPFLLRRNLWELSIVFESGYIWIWLLLQR